MEFSEGLQTIMVDAFLESGLESVVFPASLRTVSQTSFRQCEHLKTVRFSEGLEALGTDEPMPGVFERSALECVEFPSTLRSIKPRTFMGCDKLKHICLPERLEYIGKGSFSRTALESIALPSAVTAINDNAFCECVELREVTIAEGSKLRAIESKVFFGCSSLAKIDFPDGLEFIGNRCFAESGLVRVRIPKAGVHAGEGAFEGCPANDSVVFRDGRVFPKEE